MAPLAYFGIESSGFSLAVNLLILFVAVLYFSLIYWTFQDARRRIADPVMIGLSTFVACFPFVGPIIYMILRPPEYLEDVHERELELQTAEARLAQVQRGQCPYCDYRIERDFVRCPSCLRKLKERCANCSRPLDQAWTICPYCEADVPGVASPRVRRRRGGAVEGELVARLRARPRRRGGAPSPRWRTATARPVRPPPPSAAASAGRPNAARRAPRTPPPPAGDRAPPRKDLPTPTLARSADERAANADPRQAGRLRPRADGRDPRPLRAQGPEDRWRCAR